MGKEEEYISRCVYCKQLPKIIHYDTDMWYVMCGCGKHGQYSFFGIRKQYALDRWNYQNRPINRTPPKKKTKKDKKNAQK